MGLDTVNLPANRQHTIRGLSPGTRLGRYAVVRRVGSGGMAELDRQLKAINIEYKAKRDSLRLGNPIMHVMREGWYERGRQQTSGHLVSPWKCVGRPDRRLRPLERTNGTPGCPPNSPIDHPRPRMRRSVRVPARGILSPTWDRRVDSSAAPRVPPS